MGLIMMKVSGQPIKFGLDEGLVYFNISTKMILALIFYASSFLLWTGIVVKNDLSFIVPFSSAIINILSVGIGIYIFHESINIYKTIGILLAISGVILMNYK
jgi:drug/metabolite transporter (DMT)-like permease